MSEATATPAANRQGRPLVEQAAIFLMALGEDDAAQLMKFMEPREVHRVGKSMAEIEGIERKDIEDVIDNLLVSLDLDTGIPPDPDDYIYRVLVNALGKEKAMEVVERMFGEKTTGLDKMKWMDARSIAEFILKEHPQIQAVILSHLDPGHAAEVLNYFPSAETRVDIMMRVATLDSLAPNALRELNAIIEEQVDGLAASRFIHFGGTKVAAEILNNTETSIEEEVLGGIQENNELLSEQIEDLMFVFDDLGKFEDRDMQTLLKGVATDSLKVALKGSDEVVQQKIFDNMSKRAVELLQDDIEMMGPVRVSDVEAAQKEIVMIARRLADAGEIVIASSASEEMM
ncbi:MAG: flagellar motor switch protein FliG [Gammaproteobacteria bacterium]|nr:flagellar motor switch protein FliG [Gammaproteobacteria bacterium]